MHAVDAHHTSTTDTHAETHRININNTKKSIHKVHNWQVEQRKGTYTLRFRPKNVACEQQHSKHFRHTTTTCTTQQYNNTNVCSPHNHTRCTQYKHTILRTHTHAEPHRANINYTHIHTHTKKTIGSGTEGGHLHPKVPTKERRMRTTAQ